MTQTVEAAKIHQFSWAFAPPLILETALRLGVFDLLSHGPTKLVDISSNTVASERGLRVILNALVGLGLLNKIDTDEYALTPLAANYLVSTAENFQGALFSHTIALIEPWLHLYDAVVSGKPVVSLDEERVGSERYKESVGALFNLNLGSASALAEFLNIGGVATPTRVLDIGAGSGVWGIALAAACPLISVTAVDWELVTPVTRAMARRYQVDDQFSYIEGDIQKVEFGGGYRIATLGHILHSLGEESSKILLQRIFNSMDPGGTIAISEFLVNEKRTGPLSSLVFAITMFLNTSSGDVFSSGQIFEWLLDAGFVGPQLLSPVGATRLIIATRPDSLRIGVQ